MRLGLLAVLAFALPLAAQFALSPGNGQPGYSGSGITVAATGCDGVSGGGNFSTRNYNTAGASKIVAFIGSYGVAGTVTVAANDTLTAGTLYKVATGSDAYGQFYWRDSPTSTASYQFNLSAGANFFGVACVWVLDGGATSSTHDQESGAGCAASATNCHVTPSATPTANNEIVLTGFVLANSDSVTIGGTGSGNFSAPFTKAFSSGNNFAGFGSYWIQTTAAAAQPQWNYTNMNYSTAVLETFK